jgi:hypothetical protein
VYPVAEFAQKRSDGNHFISSVLEGPIVVVAGDMDRLET